MGYRTQSSIARYPNSISLLFVLVIILANEFNCEASTTESPNDPKYFVEATPFSGYNNKSKICPDSSFQCSDGTCIPILWQCDFKNDCNDKSDEIDCRSTYGCHSKQFQCLRSQRCILRDWLCDGEYDCGSNDWSDEDPIRCSNKKSCSPNQSECMGGICIDTEKFCDGKFDCINDEYADICENKTIQQQCEKLKCSHGCKATPIGAKCYCANGKQPSESKCIDIDECEESGGDVCDQKCKNTFGSFECSCVSGYDKFNETHCRARNVPRNESAKLLFTNEDHLKGISLKSSATKNFTLELRSNSHAFEVWYANRSMCSIGDNENENDKLEMICYNIDDLSISWKFATPEIFSGLKTIDQIRLDSITKNWYFVNINSGLIILCDHNMIHCTIAVENFTEKPNQLELDVTKGVMFYIKWVHLGKIEQANLDGTNQTLLVTDKIIYPCGLALDMPNEHVYWVDRYMDSIERVDYNGKNRWSLKKTALNSGLLRSVHSIAVFEDTIYVSTWSGNQSIIAIKKRDPNSAQILINNLTHPSNLRIFHLQKQPHIQHPCENRGGCDHLCIPYKNRIPKCLCSAGFQSFGTKCNPMKRLSFLIYAKQKPAMIKGIPITTLRSNGESSDAIVPILNIKWPLSLDYNVRDQLIYFGQNDVDNSKFIIESQKLDGTGRRVILQGRDNCHGIAYDWLGNNIYWATSNKIDAFGLTNTNNSKTLIYTGNAGSIALNPQKGLIYWSTWNTQEGHGLIHSAWMDGTHQSVFVDSAERDIQWPSSLTIDFVEKKLYWCDPRTSLIEKVDLDGRNREIVIKKFSDAPFQPYSVAYHNQFIFWTDNVMGNIYRVHKNFTNDKAKFEILAHEKLKVTDIRVYDGKIQNYTKSCQISCPELTLVTPEGCKCACRNDFFFNQTIGKCEPSQITVSPCEPGQYQCKTSGECIQEIYLCDRDKDCRDGSDESYDMDGPCNAKNNCTQLGDDAFKCDEKQCLRKILTCDAFVNCDNGRDEIMEVCSSSPCNDSEFRCKVTNECIPRSWVCDQQSDCADRSDEEDCIECIEFKCNNSVCLAQEKVCDGINDCGDFSDEQHCDTCRRDEMYCPYKGCLSSSHICDGIVDCFNGHDEMGCEKTTNENRQMNETFQCGTDEFHCSAGIECIPATFHCDGQKDCLDGSDETNCTSVKPSNAPIFISNDSITDCEYPNRICKDNNVCIHVTNLCDERMDCPDGSDEGFQCEMKACSKINDCSHFCNNAPEGYVCSCPLNMYLKSDGKQCSYQHACEHWGTCSQICETHGKQFKCKCLDGYTLESDKFTCRSNNPDQPYVIFSNREEIRGVDLKTFEVKNFFASLRNTIALDFLSTNDSYVQIFWTDVIDDKIFRGTLMGGLIRNVEAVVQSGLLTAEGLAVDWIGMNLYWVDSNLDQIEVAQISGNFRRTLVAGDMTSPRAIAVDPREGLMFWTDWDKSNPRIERCSMAGEQRQLIVRVDLLSGAWPNGLTLDYTMKRIYWTDARSDSIHTTDYEGQNHHLIIRDQENLSHPFSISVFENHVYWTDWRTNAVIRANKWNGSDITVIDRTSSQPFGIQVLHSSRQPRDRPNPCGKKNGGCSHLCLIDLKSYKCECPHVMRLSANNKTCIQNEQVLLFIMGSEIRGVDVQQPNHHTIPTISHSSHVIEPKEIDFLFSENQLYWTDRALNEVKTSGLSNAKIETILNGELSDLSGLAIDWVSHHIYVAAKTGQNKRILACNIKGEYITEILENLNEVPSIALDPAYGQMYFAHIDVNSTRYFIEQSSLDGSNRLILRNCTKAPSSLTMDLTNRRLYFTYKEAGIISYIDLKTKQIYEVLSASSIGYDRKIESATIYKDEIFFADAVDSTIKKCNKNICNNITILRNNTNSVLSLKMFHSLPQSKTNSCNSTENKCDHLCFAISSNDHRCKCAIGYHIDPADNNKCIGEEEFIFFSSSDSFHGVALNNLNNQIVRSLDSNFSELTADEKLILKNRDYEQVLAPIPRIVTATNIDFHYDHDLLFWSDSDGVEITSIKRDGTNRQTIVKQTEPFDFNNGDGLSGIAVDWVADNIYWSDERRNIIEVARLNGSSRYVVLSYVSKPKAIAVDPIAGFLFYAGDKKIGRTGLDGSQHFILVNQSAQASNIVLDISNQVVYWCESQTNSIWRVDYDGNSKHLLINKTLDNPLAIALYEKNLYWTDLTNYVSGIKFANINDLTNINFILISEDNTLSDLKIFSPRVQFGTNACGQNNGGCKELCLFNGTHPICACSHGEISPIDGQSCIPYDDFLVFSRVSSIESIHNTNHLNMNGPIPPIQNSTMIRNTVGLGYCYQRKRIFYSDVHLSSINWVYFNGTNHQTIVTKQVLVEGIAYDPISDQVFWTSNSEASIRAFELSKITDDVEKNNEVVRSVVQLNTRDKLRGIAIEPCLAMVYWTNWNTDAPSIQRAYITGYGVRSIITTDIRMPNAIALDYSSHKLYWADARLDKIERVNYDGTHRVVLVHSTPKHPFAITIYKNYIYWTDWVLRAVLRANKYSGAELIWLRKDIPRLMGIVAVQNTTQDCSSDPCAILNGGCEDVCSLVQGKVKCECTIGRLANDGKKCLPPVRRHCSSDQFSCISGECIPYDLTCDGVKHCMDGSDEDINFCNYRECPTGFFMCNNRRCVPQNQTCDGIENCGDGSDEMKCQCTKDHFRCDSGQCIDHNYRCDREPDCPDESDEIGCEIHDCPNTANSGAFVKCANSTSCYMVSWRCDGEFDCQDHSDEMNCTSVKCSTEHFACLNGQCINSNWRCDGEADCNDGSDETNCLNFNGTSIHCESNHFMCADGKTCIPQTWQCDKNFDCPDGSDEGRHCATRECDGFRCSKSEQCIPNHYVCDGDTDCEPGHEDEMSCDNPTQPNLTCPENMFECRNLQCIEWIYYCDGSKDCTDGSDEYPTCTPINYPLSTCDADKFQCNNGQCVFKTAMCNLSHDCEDGSDEEMELCRNSTLICAAPDFYRCANGACVSEKQLCNGVNDCGDYSDEQTCNVNECTQSIEKSLCAHNCEDRKVGYECTCNTGYKVSHKDRHLCEDIDECVDRPCSQKCTNSIGSYHCSCADGYALKDKHICKAITNEHAKLIFSNRYYIREADLSGHTTLIAHNLSNAVALDYDWETKCYYWSDVTLTISKIKRMCPFDNKTIDIHHTLLKNPDGLAVDWVAKNLYWCDKGLDTIEVSKLDGRYRKVLINKDLQEPRAIAVDPFEKYVYWTDWGDRPHIGKAGLDGSNPRVLIEDGFGWPNALTISFETGELFWGDAREDFIAVSDLNGKNRKTILSRSKNSHINLHHVFSIAVWEDRVYWTDWETKSIESCHKDRGDNCSTLLTTIHRPMDIRVFHSYRQRPTKDNPCTNAGCETLCLLSPDKPYYKCACPDNFILAKDNKTCNSNCTSAHFECLNTKKCIPFFWRCDGQDDCGDNSDEPLSCRPFTCEPGQYQCANRKCISPTQICDGQNQCGDKSDEIDCEKFVCFDTHFKCSASSNSSVFCIDLAKRCNGKVDCPNGEDEANCTCPKINFKCADGKCIPNVWVCDGDKDCADGSDELSCRERKCSKNEFSCQTGRCIPMSWKCDGESDCSSNEDEPPSCNWSNRTCEDSTYFKCDSGKCIPGRWKCDYHYDCNDRSDETNCTMRNCSESEFRCSDGRCIPGALRCNQVADCPNLSDEADCPIDCIDQFHCPNQNLCINRQYLCDGDNDCADGADETNCTCTHTQFKCNDGRCIEDRWRCDGWNDCMDKSDEYIELCRNISCAPNAFRCNNHRCVRRINVCDGNDDCGDNSDELNCRLYDKCSPKQFQCEIDHHCISKSFRCDGKSNCVDDSDEINCKASVCHFGACSQICLEKKAGYHNCRCAEGYNKQTTDKNATCIASQEPLLLIASEQNLRFLIPQKHLDASSSHGFVPISESKIDVFDYHFVNESIILYWIDLPNRNIQKMYTKILASFVRRETRSIEHEEVIISDLNQPNGIAIDWIGNRIYLVEKSTNEIISTDLDGGQRITITKTDPKPLDIVLDPTAKMMFFSTLERGIHAASMDGDNNINIVSKLVEWPTGLTIDYPAKRLYWADHRKGTIETVLYDGKSRHVVATFSNKTSFPKKIQVFEDYIFVATYDQQIYRLNKFVQSSNDLLLGGAHRASDLVILSHLNRQTKGDSPCSNNPCSDGFVCLLSASDASGKVCKCPNGLNQITIKNRLICQDTPSNSSNCTIQCNQGKCEISNGKAKCNCPIDFDGDFCEHYRCSGFCKNHGTCFVDVSTYKTDDRRKPPLKCKCPKNWTGNQCEITLVGCHETCHNGAKCILSANHTKTECICAAGYYGDSCQNCDELVCENSGICMKDKNGRPFCQCSHDYTGDRCEKNVCEGYCSGHGKCESRLGLGTFCECDHGYWGKQCQSDSCMGYCLNGGTCTVNNDNAKICQCIPPYSGLRCDHIVCSGDDCSADINQCDQVRCQNGGTCHVISGKAHCDCSPKWSGEFCETLIGESRSCENYCEHDGICKIDSAGHPVCQCTGEWIGRRCKEPPVCIGQCGNCRPGSSVNECTCSNGTIISCICGEKCKNAAASSSGIDNTEDNILTILSVLIVVFITLTSIFGIAIYLLRKRRICQPFSHARLNDCVEMTNPMYLGEIDDTPTFVHEDTKGRFTNPVYESMYAGTSEPMRVNSTNCNSVIFCGNNSGSNNSNNSAIEEKTGLLLQNEPNMQDLI